MIFDDFRENRSWLIQLIWLNIGSTVWRWSLKTNTFSSNGEIKRSWTFLRNAFWAPKPVTDF